MTVIKIKETEYFQAMPQDTGTRQNVYASDEGLWTIKVPMPIVLLFDLG